MKQNHPPPSGARWTELVSSVNVGCWFLINSNMPKGGARIAAESHRKERRRALVCQPLGKTICEHFARNAMSAAKRGDRPPCRLLRRIMRRSSAAMTEQERLRTAVEALCREMLTPIFEHLNANVVPFDFKDGGVEAWTSEPGRSHTRCRCCWRAVAWLKETHAVPRCRCDPIGAPAKPNRWGQTSTGKAATQTAAVWQ